LHDIGKVVVNQYFHSEFVTIVTRVYENNDNFIDAERDLLGTDHGEIGAWLAEKWRLPPIITESICYHHTPWDAPENPLLVGIIYLADYLSHLSHIGSSGTELVPPIDIRIWGLLQRNTSGISESMLPDIQTEFLLELDKTNTLPLLSTGRF
jgi:HD-like signal output (HDOD) protein